MTTPVPSSPGTPAPSPKRPGNLLAGVSRRVRTLVVTAALFVVLLILMMTLPVPYVVLSPGPTYNTLGTYQVNGQDQPIIAVSGHPASATTGNLNLTTVSYTTGSLTVFDALRAWLDDHESVVPRSAIFPPGRSTDQTTQQNAAEFSASQDSAIAAAGCEVGYPARFGVITVLGGGAATGKLLPGDLIRSLAGRPADSDAKLRPLLAAQAAGATVPVEIIRTGKPRTVRITLGKPLTGRNGASLGIEVGPVCQLPFAVDLGLANQIGGPSAGLMFALGIIDKIGKLNLTHGMFIAGTGTIDSAGNVGAIGGIQLKMIAARQAGATVFLAPADNCTDVAGATPSGLKIVKVSTLDGAVQDLKKIAAGSSVPGC
ncbi:MAG: YlbL family protein [Jatrophihabitantaceae bacterium]